MICIHCGKQIAEDSSYCNLCGSRQHSPFRSKLLTRSSTDSKIAGVCGGIGEYFGVDSTIVRLIWLVLSVFPGGIVGGVIAYTLAWIVIPASTGEKTVAEVPFKAHAKAS
jgi:phage shock protein PspC (stress-responsive transcriptional regulator)